MKNTKLKRESNAAIVAIIIVSIICWLCINAPRTGLTESRLLEETAVVTEIDMNKREVTVQLEKVNHYYDGLKVQPYDSREVVLCCKWMENSISIIKELKVSDKIIYTHYEDRPYRAEGIDILYCEKAIVKEIALYQDKIKVEIKESSGVYNNEKSTPYAKKEIVLDCSHMIQEKAELNSMDMLDEIIFTHFYNAPYEIKTIEMEE